MKLKELLEEFKDGFKSGTSGKYIEIFVNPTKKEFMDAYGIVGGKKYVRFIADPKSKKVYVFSPNEYHRNIHVNLNLTNDDLINIWGVAQKVGNSWMLVTSDSWKSLKDKKASTWEWLKKYINFDVKDGEVYIDYSMDKSWEVAPGTDSWEKEKK